MYCIHFNNRCMAVCNSSEEVLKDPESVIYNPGSDPQLATLPELFENSPNIKKLCIPTSQEEKTFKNIFTKLTQIQAGGGVVENSKGEYLLIYRNGLWDLPKGKQEPYEDIRSAAIREVEEECGIGDLEIRALICKTYHTYRMNGRFMLKCTHWYHMNYSGNGQTTPQIEENIEKTRWVKRAELPKYLENTYPSIREVFYLLKSTTSNPSIL